MSNHIPTPAAHPVGSSGDVSISFAEGPSAASTSHHESWGLHRQPQSNRIATIVSPQAGRADLKRKPLRRCGIDADAVSLWGSDDDEAALGLNDPYDPSGPLMQDSQTNERQSFPSRKRLHLDYEDVDRFASLSLMNLPASLSEEGCAGAKATAAPKRPDFIIPCPGTHDLSKADGQSVLGPVPPSTPISQVSHVTSLSSSWELDAHRTYVHDLRDEGEGEEQTVAAQSTQEMDETLTPLDAQHLEALAAATRNAKDQSSMHTGDYFDPSSTFQINQKLLAKLEAHSRASLVSSDMSRRKAAQPPSRDEAEGALILWKGPQALFASKSGDKYEYVGPDVSAAPSPSPSRPTSPPAMFTFGSGSSTPLGRFAPDLSGADEVGGGDMEIDI